MPERRIKTAQRAAIGALASRKADDVEECATGLASGAMQGQSGITLGVCAVCYAGMLKGS